MIEVAMGHILGQHDDFRRKKKASHLLLSKIFIDCKTRYNFLKKLYCNLV
jgi:hypothetical protein